MSKDKIQGVSEWKQEGVKYGYYDYFEKQIQKELLSDMLEICDKTENEQGRQLVEYFRKFIK